MDNQETFYLLNDTFSAALAPSFLCTVVASKSSPRTVSAPFTPADHPATALSNPSAALAHALPISSTSSNPFLTTISSSSSHTLNQFLSTYCLEATRARICTLLDLPPDNSTAAPTIAVRQYSLDSPQLYFERLIQDSRRAKDVRALLNQCLPRYAYFVTGFLTVADITALPSHSPFTETIRFVTPFLQLPHHPSPHLPEPLRARFSHEHIFAVSYAVVKLSSASPSSPQGSSSKTEQTMPPDFGRPTRANGTHIASASRTMEHWTNEQTARSVPSTPLAASATLAHAAVSAASPTKIILDENEPFLRDPNTDALFIRLPKSS